MLSFLLACVGERKNEVVEDNWRLRNYDTETRERSTSQSAKAQLKNEVIAILKGLGCRDKNDFTCRLQPERQTLSCCGDIVHSWSHKSWEESGS